MNLISKISAATILLFSFSSCNAQIKNAKTESVKIYGNCEMCEKTIETAGSVKKIANVDWNKDSKMATITYDSTKTNQDEILKRIALAGYDSDKFLAPDDVYSKLAGCCQYERVNKTAIVSTAVIELMFPTIYGGNLFAVLVSLILLAAYLILAWFSARERPP